MLPSKYLRDLADYYTRYYELYKNPTIDPIQLLIDECYKHDVDVVCHEMPLDCSVDGHTEFRMQHNTIFIVINSNISNIRRRRFTMAHEVAHILLGNVEHSEWDADALASYLLMPPHMMLAFWKRNCWINKDNIIKTFDVSDQAAGMRLFNFLENECPKPLLRRSN